MVTDTGSVVWLWILQVALWLGWTLPLAAVAILIALGLRGLNRQARAIEREAVEPGRHGFWKLTWNKIAHGAIGWSMWQLILGGLALGGALGLLLQALIEPAVHEATGEGSYAAVEAVAAPPTGDAVLDLILFLGLVLGVAILLLGVFAYRALRSRAGMTAAQLGDAWAARPLLVRWFNDSPGMGVLVVVIAGWVCFGIAMQVVGLVVVLVPVPETVTDLPLAWATPVMIGVVVAIGVLAFTALLGLPVTMGLRRVAMDVRHYRGNPTFRMIANASATIGGGLVGGLLYLHLLDRMGVLPASAGWGDIVLGVIPGLWLLAYLLAYALAIVGQALLRRRVGTRFNLANVALACVLAALGAVPIFAVLWRLHLLVLAGILG